MTYDRGGLAQGTIEQLRDEIIQVIAKHLAINEDEIEINFDRTTRGRQADRQYSAAYGSSHTHE